MVELGGGRGSGFESPGISRLLACAKRFGIAWRKKKKKNPPLVNPATKSAYKFEQAIEIYRNISQLIFLN